MSLPPKSEAFRRRMLNRFAFWLWRWKDLPLAAWAGLRLVGLDEGGCTVFLPGGWRTRNPFRSTYFAAQAMAAEMSTGLAAAVLVEGAPASVAMLLTEFHALYRKRIIGPSYFTFENLADMQAAVEKAAAGPEPHLYVARSIARDANADVCSEFAVTWSFKRRS